VKSVNPIPTREVDYAHHITAFPAGFENLTASLYIIINVELMRWIIIVAREIYEEKTNHHQIN
jgi:hypothetical protein